MSEQSSLDSDLLYGGAAIAKFVFGHEGERRKVYNFAEERHGADKLPCFRIGGVLCARKSTLMSWIEAREKSVA